VTLIALGRFAGRVPRQNPKLLAANQAQTAKNCKGERNMLEALADLYESESDICSLLVVDSNGDEVIDTGSDNVITGQVVSIYKLVDAWLRWDCEVDVVKSFIPDSDNRIYFTGDGVPKKTNYTLATSGAEYTYPTTTYSLGVTAPTAPLTAAADGSGDGNVERSTAYVYTYVTTWGEESAPSPPSNVIDIEGGQHCDLTGFATGEVNVAYVRLYRVASGSDIAEYELVPYKDDNVDLWTDAGGAYSVDDVVKYTPSGEDQKMYICIQETSDPPEAPTDTDYWTEIFDPPIADVVANGFKDEREDTDLGDALLTEDWATPPTDLAGLILISNTVLAGFSGNEVCFSEPGYPYAWPTKYRKKFDSNIVALGYHDEITVVTTEDRIHLIMGTDPQGMTQIDLHYHRPNDAKAGTVSTPHGVVFPSKDGLMIIRAGEDSLLTKDLWTKEQWEALSTSDLLCAYHEDKLFGFFKDTKTGFYLDIADLAQGIFDIEFTDEVVKDVMVLDGVMYLFAADVPSQTYNIYEWEGATGDLTYTWKSKEIHYLFGVNFSVGMVVTEGSLTLKVYGDGTLKDTISVTSDDPFRLSGGYIANIFEIEATGTADFDVILVATSIDEIISFLEGSVK